MSGIVCLQLVSTALENLLFELELLVITQINIQ